MHSDSGTVALLVDVSLSYWAHRHRSLYMIYVSQYRKMYNEGTRKTREAALRTHMCMILGRMTYCHPSLYPKPALQTYLDTRRLSCYIVSHMISKMRVPTCIPPNTGYQRAPLVTPPGNWRDLRISGCLDE